MLNIAANLSMLFTEVPLLARFALAKSAGFDAVEIQFPYELSIAAIAEQLTVNDLKLVLINVPALDLMQGGDGLACVPTRELLFQAAVQQAIDYATALQVPCVNILAGRQPQGVDVAHCERVLVSNLRDAAVAFTAHDITPVIEAINGVDMPRFAIQTLADMRRILALVNHPRLAMQYDCYHMAMMGEDVYANLRTHLAQIKHIQFADWPNRHEPWTGELDFSAIFAWIAQSDYTGYCGAEYRPIAATLDGLDWLKRL